MKTGVVYSILLFFVIHACTDRNNNFKHTTSGNDTAIINKILLQVEQKQFKSADSSLKYLTKAEHLSKKNDYQEGYIKALFLHGNILYNNNNYDEAKNYYSQALDLSNKLDATLLKAKCLERLASVHLATDDPSKALKLYYESLPLFEKAHDKEGIAKVYNIIGVFKTGSHDFDTAELYLHKAIELNSKIKNNQAIIENEGNLGYLFEQTGKLEAAQRIYFKLVDELKALDDKLNLPVLYFNIASLYQKKEMTDSALYFLGRAADIAEQTSDSSMLCTVYGNTGEIFLDNRNMNLASVYLNKSIACSRAIDDVETEMQALTLLLKVDSISGNFKAAYYKSQQISVLKDSVYQRKIDNNVHTSELQYENEKRQGLIEIQQLTIKTAKKERVLYMVLLAVSLISFGLLSRIFILRRRNYIRNKELFEKQILVNNLQLHQFQKEEEITKLKIEKVERELKIKEQELVSIAMGIEQKNELLTIIRKKIANSTNNASGENHFKIIDEIVSLIKMHPNETEDSDLFNQRFSLIHRDFYLNLKKAHPELTKTELKFCAYLRIHLSGSQISNILSVTSEAIRKTRYRIRKKMNLTPGESLEEYISKF